MGLLTGTPTNLSTLQHPNLLAITYNRRSLCTSDYIFSGEKRLSVSCGCKLRNNVMLVPYQHKSSRQLIVKAKSREELTLTNGLSLDKLIKDHTDIGSFEDAIKVYINVLKNGSFMGMDNVRSFSLLVKAVGELSDIALGLQIFGHVLKLGGLDDIYVANSFLSMLWKCSVVDDAAWMFDKMQARDSVSWSTMISGLYQSMRYYDALEVLSEMTAEPGPVFPNRIACMSALLSCSMIRSLMHGREIHALSVKTGLDVDSFVASSLLEMYMKCGDVLKAKFVFKRMSEDNRKNAIFWNVMISGYVSNGNYGQASSLFVEMMLSGIKPDSSTMVAVLVLCLQSSDLVLGRQVHALIVKADLEKNIRVRTALVDMYFECSDDESGLKSFRSTQDMNLVMWGTVISNFVRSNRYEEAMDLFRECRIDQNIVDSVIMLGALRACSSLKYKLKGMEIHGIIVKLGFDIDAHVGGALVDMYMECSDIVSALSIFVRLKRRDAVSWNALICGYAQNNYVSEALETFLEMQAQAINPNQVTISCLLSLCSRISTLFTCKEIHGYILRQGLETNALMGNSLLASYAKCGDIKSSLSVFERIKDKDRVSWNSIIQGMGMLGGCDESIQLFHKMKVFGLKPDHMTFTSILSACSHAGRLDEGLKYFKSMSEEYNLEPRIQQYTCMVDLLGRAGYLDQAYDMIMALPCPSDDRIWGSLLSSCRIHNNERMARLVSDRIFKLEPCNSTGYHVLLANLYEDVGRWKDAAMTRSSIKEMGIQKTPGCSWIEVENQMHVFTASDQSHNQCNEIYSTLGGLTLEMKQSGYKPQSGSVNECSVGS